MLAARQAHMAIDLHSQVSYEGLAGSLASALHAGCYRPAELIRLHTEISACAGKSSMLDILAGRKTNQGLSGAVRMNGSLIRPETTSKYISYVSQVPHTSAYFSCLVPGLSAAAAAKQAGPSACVPSLTSSRVRARLSAVYPLAAAVCNASPVTLQTSHGQGHHSGALWLPAFCVCRRLCSCRRLGRCWASTRSCPCPSC